MFTNDRDVSIEPHRWPNPYDKEKPAYCAQCGEESYWDDMVEIGGSMVCPDCIDDWCQVEYMRLGNKYIESQKADFLLYWIENLEKDELVRVLEPVYRREEALERAVGATGLKALRKAFCTKSDADDWRDFVIENLKEEAINERVQTSGIWCRCGGCRFFAPAGAARAGRSGFVRDCSACGTRP